MTALAVYPGSPNSIHLAEFPKPAAPDVLGGRDVLVRILQCDVDGLDTKINVEYDPGGSQRTLRALVPGPPKAEIPVQHSRYPT